MAGALDMIKQLVSLESGMNNAKLQRMELTKKNIEFNEYVKTLPEQRKLKEGQFYLDKLGQETKAIDLMQRIPQDVQSPEVAAQLDTAMKHHAMQAASTATHFTDPLLASMAPPANPNEEKIRDASMEYSAMLMKDNGVPTDQIELYRESAQNIAADASKSDRAFSDTYETVDASMDGFLKKNYPEYDPDDASLEDDQELDIKMLTYQDLLMKKFTEVEDDPAMTFDERVDYALTESSNEFNLGSPAQAHVMVKNALEGLANYRTSEQTKVQAEIDGFNSINLTQARDGLLRMGFDLTQLTPTDMVNRMNNSLGYGQMVEIARGVQKQGDDTSLYSDLNKYVKGVNPSVNLGDMNEGERKNLVQKNFLDSMQMSVANSSVPLKEKLATINILKSIDAGVDKGQMEPEIRTMLDHVYGRWVEGYSGIVGEDSRKIESLQQSGKGFVRGMDNKIIATRGDFEKLTQVSANNKQNSQRAIHYRDQMRDLPASAGFDFVRETADPDYDRRSGTGKELNIDYGNMQFYLGSYGAGQVNIGLKAITNKLGSGEGVESIPAFSQGEGKALGKKVMRNITALESFKTLSGVDKVQGGDKNKRAIMSGLFMKAGKNNPIDAAGLELEKFGDYYIPDTIMESLESGDSPETSNMLKAMKNTNDVRMIGAGVLHMYQYNAQSAADASTAQLVSAARHVYPGVQIAPDGKLPNIMKVSAEAELDHMAKEIPFILDKSTTHMTASMQDDMYKFALNLEDRMTWLESADKSNEKDFPKETRALFTGSSAEMIAKDTKGTIGLLEELHDVAMQMAKIPIQGSGSSIGMGAGVDRSTFKRNEALLKKNKKKSERLLNQFTAIRGSFIKQVR